jgi:hypothetical protein
VASAFLSGDVFVNCPFDDARKPIFEAIAFTIYDLGFVVRCALEEDDSSELRFAKIERIVAGSEYTIFRPWSWIRPHDCRVSTFRSS